MLVFLGWIKCLRLVNFNRQIDEFLHRLILMHLTYVYLDAESDIYVFQMLEDSRVAAIM